MDNKVRDILDSVSLYEGLEHHFRLKFSEELESRLGNEHPIEYPFKGTKTQQNAFKKGFFLFEDRVKHIIYLFRNNIYEK